MTCRCSEASLCLREGDVVLVEEAAEAERRVRTEGGLQKAVNHSETTVASG